MSVVGLQVSEFVGDLDFKNLVLKWLQNFVSHVSLNLVKGYFCRFNQEVLSQMLVDVPNVARLEKLEMAVKGDFVSGWNVIQHIILME